MTTHSATLAWKIPWTEEPCRLQSMGSLRVGHDWVTSLHFNNKYKLLSGASQVALVVKESACQCRRHRRHWFYWKIPQKGNGNPFQDSCLRNSMNRGATVCGVAKKVGQLSLRALSITFTFHFRSLEKEMATHSSVLAWRIPGTGEPGGLPSMGSHSVGHEWSDLAAAAAALSNNSP